MCILCMFYVDWKLGGLKKHKDFLGLIYSLYLYIFCFQRGQGASGNQYPNLRYGVEVADNEVMEDGPGDEGYDEIDGPMPPQPSACNR